MSQSALPSKSTRGKVGRRRGVSIAAAALSVALVAPMVAPINSGIAVNAVASTPAEAGTTYPGNDASGVYQTSVGETVYVFTPGQPKNGAIESEGNWRTAHTINGQVLNSRGGSWGQQTDTNTSVRQIPMQGVRVYAQYQKYNGYVSPIYTTTTNSDGRFSILMKTVVDVAGQPQEFLANPSLPFGEKIRVWADNPDGTVFQQMYSYGNGSYQPTDDALDTTVGWAIGPHFVDNIALLYAEKPKNETMHNMEAAQEVPYQGTQGWVSGKIAWEQSKIAGAISWGALMNPNNGSDVAVKNMKVYGSYLSDYALTQIYAEPLDTFNHYTGRSLRGRGWNADNEAALQNWIRKKIAEEGKDKWIAETVVAHTDAKGVYTLQFNGTFGSDYNRRGYDDGLAVYTDLARKGTDIYDRFGTVAANPKEGSWHKNQSGRGLGNAPKHVNWEFVFVSPEEVEGLGVFGNWPANAYKHDRGIVASNVEAAASSYIMDANFLLYSDYIVFKTTPYDNVSRYAAPGDTAQTQTSGIPGKFVDNRAYQVIWEAIDAKGNHKEVKVCDPVDPLSNGTLPSCDITVPEDLNINTTYIAKLYYYSRENNSRGEYIAADSFIAIAGYVPNYEPTLAQPGVKATSKEPTYDRTNSRDTESLPGADVAAKSYALPPNYITPEGYTVEVDPNTGAVSVTFPDSAKPGDALDVPVVVTFNDNTTATGSAHFELQVDKTADVVEPAYQPVSAPRGTTADVPAPTFTGKDGQPATLPENTKFSWPTDAQVPDGATIDEATGAIKWPIPADAEVGKEITVPVLVTYADGSTDTVEVKITPTENDADTYTPAYKETTGKPDSTVNVDAPTFTDKGGQTVATPQGTKFEAGQNAPEGVTVNQDGSLTVKVPADAKPGTPITVPVKVTYPDGTSEEVQATVNVIPTDAENLEPAYAAVTGKAGQDAVSEAPTFTDKGGQNAEKPQGTKFGKPGDAPADVEYTVDPDSGVVTVKVPVGTASGTVLTVPVEVTYPDGTKDTTNVNVTVDKTQAEVTNPKWDETSGRPGTSVTVPNTGDKLPDGATAKVQDKNGTEIGQLNPDGSVTINVPDSAQPGQPIDVEVVVSYPDGSKETIPTKVNVVANPNWDDAATKPGKPITIDNNGGVVPDGTTVEKVGPGTATIDENGSITVTPNPDAKPGETITVTVKDKDGKVIDTITVTVDPTDAQTYEPAYAPLTGKGGEVVKSGEPTFTDKDGQPAQAPTGTTYGKPENAPQTYTYSIDPQTGVVSVTVPVGTASGTVITVPVEVTYPDGTKDTTNVNVTVDKNQADLTNPQWNETSGRPGTSVTVPNTGDKLPDGTNAKVQDKNGTGIGHLNPDGSITIDVPQDAKPGEPIDVNVVVAYPDGSTETIPTKVNVVDNPAWDDATTKPGQKVDVPNKGGVVPEGTTIDKTGPGTAVLNPDGSITVTPDKDAQPGSTITVTVKDKDGKVIDTITVTVDPTDAQAYEPAYGPVAGKPGETVKSDEPTFTDKDGQKTEKPQGTKFGKPGDAPADVNYSVDPDTGVVTVTVGENLPSGSTLEIPVEVTYPDGSKETTTVTVTVDKTQAEITNPKWDETSGRPGTSVTVPNTGDKLPDGATAKVQDKNGTEIGQLNPDGSVTINVPDSAQPGQPIDVEVVVSYPDGSKETIPTKVNVVDNPAWDDATTKPGQKVDVPNKGGVVPEGTTIDKTGPGTAVLNPDGSITVTPDKDAQPGSTITVTVKDKDGKVIDTITVTVDQPDAVPHWNGGTVMPGESKDFPNVGGNVTEGTTINMVEGPGTAVLNNDGSITVTANDDATPGDTIKVNVVDKDGTPVETLEITVSKAPWKPSDKCIATGLGLGIPYLLLAPIGLADQVKIPGADQAIARAQAQITEANTQLQQGLGIYNPELARWAQELNATLASPQVQKAARAVGLVLIGLLAGGIILDACLPGGLSSEKETTPALPNGDKDKEGTTAATATGAATQPATDKAEATGADKADAVEPAADATANTTTPAVEAADTTTGEADTM